MKKEIKKRYIVTTIGNCFLHGFEKWYERLTDGWFQKYELKEIIKAKKPDEE